MYPHTFSQYRADVARNLTIRDGGGTFTPSGTLASIPSGYAVGGAVTPVSVPTDAQTDFRVTFARFRAYAQERGAYVGTWQNGAEIVLDVTTIETGLEVAIWLAQFRGEKAIYDFANSRVIVV